MLSVRCSTGICTFPAAGGLSGGYSEQTLTAIAEMAKEHKVNYIITESNFGDGMFNELLKPYLTRIYPVSIEEVRHSTQKEKRIIDTLEPVMAGHKLVIDP
jgi:ABC-type Zn uptake system ZnuABC Zn-binding protein ZnuA